VLTSEKLGLPHNPVRSVAAARSKAQSRERLRAAGLPVPRFQVVPRDLVDLDEVSVPFPCVVKPLVLSGSRGVIRADTPAELREALRRVAALLQSPDACECESLPPTKRARHFRHSTHGRPAKQDGRKPPPRTSRPRPHFFVDWT